MNQNYWHLLERAQYALSFYFKSSAKFLAVVLVLVLISCPLYSADLDSLLIQSVGGPQALEKIKSMKSYRLSGRINWNGLEGTYEGLFYAPNKVKITADFGQFSIVQGFDGTTAWQKDIHGRVFELAGFEKKELIRSAYFMSFSFVLNNLDNDSAIVEPTKDPANFNIPGYKTALSPDPDDIIEIFFDSASGLLIKTTSWMDNVRVQTDLSDYRAVEGVLFPFSSKSTGENTPMITAVTIDSAKLNLDLLESDFFEPTARMHDYHFPADSNFVSIPFIYRNGHVLVPVEVNGVKKGWFILDTGASATYYDSKFANDLGLIPIGSLPSMGLGGYEQIQLVRMDSLQIGKITLYNQTAGVLPLDNLAVFAQKKTAFGGILGYDFFMRFPVLIDFKKQLLTILNPESYSLPEHGISHKIHLTLMIPTVNAQISGIPGDFLIDLGNALGLIINKNFGETLLTQNLIDTAGVPVRNITGVGPGVLGRNIMVESMQIGAYNIKIPETILAESSDGLTGSWEIAGNIGTKILEQYAVLFDYPSSRIVFYESTE